MCKSCHADHFWKAGRYKLAAPVPKTGSGQTRGRSITDAFRHFGRVPTLNRNTQQKEMLCDLLSVTKASCSIARATNQSQPKHRDLLLLIRKTAENLQLDRFLCGHDERNWFVAGTASIPQQVRRRTRRRLLWA
jgi:hypothetical protein